MKTCDTLNEFNKNYFSIWDKHSCIRSSPMFQIDFEGIGDFYPSSRFPILLCDEIKSLGPIALKEIEILAFVKYLKDIISLEILPINQTCNEIFFDELPIKYPDSIKLNSLTILIDEYFHVLIAQDIINQIYKKFKFINSFHFPKSDAYNALIDTKNELPKEFQQSFQLIAVSIFETTIVKELIDFFKNNNLNQSIKRYVKEHVNDEAKHYNFFSELMKYSWENYDAKTKKAISVKLITFIKRYFSINSWKDFSFNILNHFIKNNNKAIEINEELYNNFDVCPDIPIIQSTLDNIKKAGIADDPEFKKSLKENNWVI